jgi:hypothetical protein
MRIAIPPRRTMALATVAVAIPLWAACGSSSPGGGAATKAPNEVCHKILAVLSDGPDPSVDPVGYALSQILPLGQIHTSDHGVATTLSALMAADRALVKSNGADTAAKTEIKKADSALNAVCPGVAP